MLATLTAEEVAEWIAIYSREPLSEGRLDVHAAVLSWRLEHLWWRYCGAKGTAPKLGDYLIDFSGEREPKRDPSPEDAAAMDEAILRGIFGVGPEGE